MTLLVFLGLQFADSILWHILASITTPIINVIYLPIHLPVIGSASLENPNIALVSSKNSTWVGWRRIWGQLLRSHMWCLPGSSPLAQGCLLRVAAYQGSWLPWGEGSAEQDNFPPRWKPLSFNNHLRSDIPTSAIFSLLGERTLTPTHIQEQKIKAPPLEGKHIKDEWTYCEHHHNFQVNLESAHSSDSTALTVVQAAVTCVLNQPLHYFLLKNPTLPPNPVS